MAFLPKMQIGSARLTLVHAKPTSFFEPPVNIQHYTTLASTNPTGSDPLGPLDLQFYLSSRRSFFLCARHHCHGNTTASDGWAAELASLVSRPQPWPGDLCCVALELCRTSAQWPSREQNHQSGNSSLMSCSSFSVYTVNVSFYVKVRKFLLGLSSKEGRTLD